MNALGFHSKLGCKGRNESLDEYWNRTDRVKSRLLYEKVSKSFAEHVQARVVLRLRKSEHAFGS